VPRASAPIEWDDVRVFVAAAREGSIAAAAKRLAVDHATVSRRLASFERTLGMPLFLRTRLGLALTDDGSAVLAIVAPAEVSMLELERHRDARSTVGRVKLATSSILSAWLLAPHVSTFREQNPDVELEFTVGSKLVDLTRREADLALRLRPPGKQVAEPNILAIKLAVVGFALYGTREQLRARPRRFIRYGGYEPAADKVRAYATGTVTTVLVDHIPTAVTLARAGLGVTILPCFLADGEPSLVRASRVLESHKLYLTCTVELRRAPRIECVVRWLRDLISSERERLAGE
jgi:DNA-binding transcriptional LysR family regulator